MKIALLLFVCLTTSSLVSVYGGGLKVLGGFVEEYSADSRQLFGKSFRWGKSAPDANSKLLQFTQMFCTTIQRQTYGYCYQYLVVSTKDDPDEEHFQIIGSYQRLFEGSVQLDTINRYGNLHVRPPYQKIHVSRGKVWSPMRSDFKDGNLYFITNRTSQASITDDISFIVHKVGHHNRVTRDQCFLDYHEGDSKRYQISEVKGWTPEWGDNSYRRTYIFSAPATLLSMIPLNDQANLISLNIQPRDGIILRNLGSGVSYENHPQIEDSESVTVTSESRFLRSWDFAFSLAYTMTVNAFTVSSSVTISTSFAYHTEREMTQTRSVQTSMTILWPTECPPGFKIKYDVSEIVEVQDLPVVLTFDRAGVTWNETDILRVTLKKLEITKNDCCIEAWADELCGTESLNMCGNLLF